MCGSDSDDSDSDGSNIDSDDRDRNNDDCDSHGDDNDNDNDDSNDVIGLVTIVMMVTIVIKIVMMVTTVIKMVMVVTVDSDDSSRGSLKVTIERKREEEVECINKKGETESCKEEKEKGSKTRYGKKVERWKG